ncbi:glycoside hydrolase family 28 protein [Enterobacteriaceae endosymbiont of Macroplea appendiculata]|uniref:glycoside hydrolase family 28 protein n=1 Tax=Enterobacteriaceae endosymbiont of Macroplea appendiculata TaxID=2675790 RepID=UPI001448C834|nr:glycosyl hydrolase family 28 protein [Enterobacteriaceae endosymbiont of Macroplea appendiculata]QJC31051.1 hypothetical protein GJT86_02260 [Enterobacteriaceae endosymbiont of Macroplea appendiculata]
MKILFRQKNKILFYICILFLFSKKIFAEDQRIVHEPIIPKICQVLEANDEQDSTLRIQQAINYCAQKHQIVSLISSKNKQHVFYISPISIPDYGGLLIDQTVTVAAISNPLLFDLTDKHECGNLSVISSVKHCKPLITIHGKKNGIYGNGYIDGQGGVLIKNKKYTWWQLASEAQIQNKQQNAPQLININDGNNTTLYKIHLINSPNFHIVSHNTNGLTIWGVTIKTPEDARNTDGIDPTSSQNITITHSYISTGDDNIAIKAGKQGTSKNMTIINNVFGHGHGMSIGSEIQNGVSNVLIKNLSLINTTNGLRIKSDSTRGGLVTNINFNNVCMLNVKKPIVLDTFYNKKLHGNYIPQYKKIHFDNINVLTSGEYIFNGFNEKNIIEVFFKNVHIKPGSIWIKKYVHITGFVDYDVQGDHCPKYNTI